VLRTPSKALTETKGMTNGAAQRVQRAAAARKARAYLTINANDDARAVLEAKAECMVAYAAWHAALGLQISAHRGTKPTALGKSHVKRSASACGRSLTALTGSGTSGATTS
jgi:hypothetical protein